MPEETERLRLKEYAAKAVEICKHHQGSQLELQLKLTKLMMQSFPENGKEAAAALERIEQAIKRAFKKSLGKK